MNCYSSLANSFCMVTFYLNLIPIRLYSLIHIRNIMDL